MYDGTNFMGIKDFSQCQFFETEFLSRAAPDADDATGGGGGRGGKGRPQYMKECPPEDTCCFSLREYMNIDFWGRKSIIIQNIKRKKISFDAYHKVHNIVHEFSAVFSLEYFMKKMNLVYFIIIIILMSCKDCFSFLNSPNTSPERLGLRRVFFKPHS